MNLSWWSFVAGAAFVILASLGGILAIALWESRSWPGIPKRKPRFPEQ